LLIQTISRVNRKFPGKEYGFIIDYIGIRENMREAMKIYGGDNSVAPTADDVEQATERLMLVELNKLPQNERLDVQRVFEHFESDEFQKILEEAIYNSLVNVINALRRKVKVCCVTTRRDNRNMWENYAAQYTGFVIEYKTENALKRSECVSTLAQMFPVTYYKRFPKVPLLPFIQQEFDKALYNRERDILPSIKQLNKQLISKKYDYRAEEEWRVLTPRNRIEFPLISAVYAGYRIREEDLNRLKDCCKMIGVPLYKQQLGLFDDSMRYEQIR